MPSIDVAGNRIYVTESGRGSPILFLHGNPDSADLWSGVIDRLDGRRRSIAIDLPGFARSEASDDFDYSLKGQSKFVATLLNSLEIDEPVNLVCHDFGGTFALSYLSNFPEKVRSVVISNTAFFADYRWHFWARIWKTPVLGEIAMALPMGRSAFRREMRKGSKRLTDVQIDQVYDRLTPRVKSNVLRLYRSVNPGSFPDWENRFEAAARRVPVLVLWGDGDPYISDSYADRFFARRVIHYPEAGHWLPMVDPEAFASELTAFLDEVENR
jgi:pimeloyl-ACP methyl ester carboxylesterase